jgi:hypothetical protein
MVRCHDWSWRAQLNFGIFGLLSQPIFKKLISSDIAWNKMTLICKTFAVMQLTLRYHRLPSPTRINFSGCLSVCLSVCPRTRARLDDCTFVIGGAIETSLGTIRLRRWRRKRSQCVRLHTLQSLTGEGLLDEAIQEKIGNLLDGEVGQFYRLRDLQVWPVFEILVALLDLIWINSTWLHHYS